MIAAWRDGRTDALWARSLPMAAIAAAPGGGAVSSTYNPSIPRYRTAPTATPAARAIRAGAFPTRPDRASRAESAESAARQLFIGITGI